MLACDLSDPTADALLFLYIPAGPEPRAVPCTGQTLIQFPFISLQSRETIREQYYRPDPQAPRKGNNDLCRTRPTYQALIRMLPHFTFTTAHVKYTE